MSSITFRYFLCVISSLSLLCGCLDSNRQISLDVNSVEQLDLLVKERLLAYQQVKIFTEIVVGRVKTVGSPPKWWDDEARRMNGGFMFPTMVTTVEYTIIKQLWGRDKVGENFKVGHIARHPRRIYIDSKRPKLNKGVFNKDRPLILFLCTSNWPADKSQRIQDCGIDPLDASDNNIGIVQDWISHKMVDTISSSGRRKRLGGRR